MQSTRGVGGAVLVAGVIGGAAPSALGKPSFHTFDGNPQAVSADGRFVAGREQRQAFRWSQSGGLELLGRLPGGTDGYAEAISADGSVIAGSDLDNIGRSTAFRWESGVMSALDGPVPSGTSPDWRVEYAHDMAADGSVIVGSGFQGFPAGWGNAYRWTVQEGFSPIPSVPGFIPTSAWGTTPDGRIVSGGGWDGQRYQAYRWSEQTGMELLGGPAGFTDVGASEISDDGSVLLSNPFADELGTRAYRWHNGLWEDLGDIDPSRPSTFIVAYAVSGDGTMIVGSDVEFARPFVWTEGRGMLDLQAWLVDEHGLDLGGYELEYAFDMTPDGRTFVGTARDPSGQQVGYLITVPAPGAGALLAASGCLAVRRRRRGAWTD